jgi:hypothetical protein
MNLDEVETAKGFLQKLAGRACEANAVEEGLRSQCDPVQERNRSSRFRLMPRLIRA